MKEPTPTHRTADASTPDPTLAYEPPSYGPPAAPAPGHGYPAPSAAAAPATGVPTSEDRNWATAAHLSGFVAAYLALGFIGPLVVMLTAGRRSPFVRRHAVEALNFNLTVLLALFVSAVLVVVLVGFLMLALVGIGYVAFSIAGALAAARGDEFRYPLTIRFVS